MDTSAPSTVVGYTTLEGSTAGSITVLDGGTLLVAGAHDGAVVLEGGATLAVSGALSGPLEIASLATATVTGDVVGPIVVRVAGTLVVEPTGRVAGPVTNHGSFTNRGYRSGPVDGREPDDQADAVHAEPVHPGVYNYVLSPRD
jgi:hypothetical protein